MALRLCIALVLALAALPAQAQVYKWVDAKGQVNYGSAPPPTAAGSTQQVEEKLSVMGMDPAVRAYADRLFAARAAADERDWQFRQSALSVQYASAPASPSYDDSYYSTYPGYYYGAYYGGAYYKRPYLPLARAHVKHHHHGTAPRPTPHTRVSASTRGHHPYR